MEVAPHSRLDKLKKPTLESLVKIIIISKQAPDIHLF